MSHVTVFTMMVYQYEIIFQRITNNRTKNVYIMNRLVKKKLFYLFILFILMIYFNGYECFSWYTCFKIISYSK